jgi:taurine dioxygenase
MAATLEKGSTAAGSLEVRAQKLGVQVKPLHKKLGVQVSGLDLNKPLSDEQRALLMDLWRHYDLLAFRGQELSPQSQERLLRVFPHDAKAIDEGRFCNMYFQPRVPSNPLLAVRGHNVNLKEHCGLKEEQLAKLKLGGAPFDESRLWHMDMSDTPMPCQVSAMYMYHPAPGGVDNTLFVSGVSGFEELEPELKEKLMKLKSVNAKPAEFYPPVTMNWEGTRRLDDVDAKIKQAKDEGKWFEMPPNPFIIKDPDTGKRSILMSAQRVHHFEGMSRPESQDLLEEVLTKATADANIYDHEWQPHDFIIWANRRIIHSASPAKHYTQGDAKGMRLFHLVFLDSNQPVHAASEA